MTHLAGAILSWFRRCTVDFLSSQRFSAASPADALDSKVSVPRQHFFKSMLASRLMAGLVVCLGSVSLSLLSSCTRDSNPPSNNANDHRGESRTPIAAVELSLRDLSRELATSAAVEPLVRIRLASRTSGTVKSVHFEEGDRVSKGEVLAELDMSEAKAELARATAVAEQARLAYHRQAELLETRLISPSDYDQSRTDLAVAESEQKLWETRIEFGRITAPRDAVVTHRYIEPGEAIENNEIAFELAAMDELVLRVGVSELDVVHLERGQSVPVRFDAMPESTMQSTIRRIYPTAERQSRLVTVEVALPGDAAERGIRPGFLARIRMPIDERPDVIAVPSAAIGQDGDGQYVYVVSDDRLHRRTVETGATRGQWTQVTEGLDVGEIVLATNPIDMNDGQAVRIVGWRG
jgi:membrane fusion protein (multidrug efflux system)